MVTLMLSKVSKCLLVPLLPDSLHRKRPGIESGLGTRRNYISLKPPHFSYRPFPRVPSGPKQGRRKALHPGLLWRSLGGEGGSGRREGLENHRDGRFPGAEISPLMVPLSRERLDPVYFRSGRSRGGVGLLAPALILAGPGRVCRPSTDNAAAAIQTSPPHRYNQWEFPPP